MAALRGLFIRQAALVISPAIMIRLQSPVHSALFDHMNLDTTAQPNVKDVASLLRVLQLPSLGLLPWDRAKNGTLCSLRQMTEDKINDTTFGCVPWDDV